jgi:hypothetical protein
MNVKMIQNAYRTFPAMNADAKMKAILESIANIVSILSKN